MPAAPKRASAYARLAEGALDPTWWYGGREAGSRQAQSVDRIGKTTVTIPDGTFAVQRHTIKNGDFPNYGGNRCEVLDGNMELQQGDRGQFGFGVILAPGFRSDGSGWNSLCDLHYPNDGLAQSPFTMSIRNSTDLYVNIKGGPVSSDHTRGTKEIDKQIATLQTNKLYRIGIDLLQDPVNGRCHVWVNGIVVFSQDLPTISPGVPNSVYWKQGFYCSASSQAWAGERSMLFTDTGFFTEQTPDAMIMWLGAPTTDPPPAPPPPVGALTAHSSIQADDTLQVGATVDWVVTTSVPADSCEFFVDGASVRKIEPQKPVQSFAHMLIVPRAKTVGFEVIAGAQKQSFRAYPVTVKEAPVPVKTNAQLRDEAVAHLQQTGRGLKGYTPAAGSHWKAALDLLGKIK